MNSIAAPYNWPQSDVWLGLDGNWSTLPISVGTPPQRFNVVPSTSGQQIWVPMPEGCSWMKSDLSTCAFSRGVNTTTSSASLGFQANVSSTWQQIGLYGLDTEVELYGRDENGLFGQDNVTLGPNETATRMSEQAVAGIASSTFWLGSVGLSDEPSSFNTLNNEVPSLLGSMQTKNMTASSSFGLFAGASYRSSPASLVLGGYDQAAGQAGAASFTIPQNHNLLVNLASIVATNTLLGTASMLVSSTGLTMRIDSLVSQLWLPVGVCGMFAKSFGLLYDNTTNLYLINSTMHAKIQQLDPQLTFTIATGPGSSDTVDIALPYAAFDMTVGLPVYNSTYRYFPIRRAANETQYVLGRAFLQEAYLVVDWDRKNFSLSQAVHQTGKAMEVVPILSPESMAQTSPATVPAGAIAGAVTGAVVLVITLGVLYRCWRRRRAVDKAHDEPTNEVELTVDAKYAPAEWPDEKANVELMSGTRYELNAAPKPPAQVMSTEIFELDAVSPSTELEADSPATLPVYEK